MRAVSGFCKKNSFWAGYFPGIIGVSFSGLVFEQMYLISPDWPSYYFLTTTNFLLLTLCYISFYQCIFLKNKLPDFLPAPRLKHQLKHNHPLYTDINKCQKQNEKYKPPRTSHCHEHGCIIRFDHHCPYINNCLGLINLKAFILFNAYGGIFALQFFFLSIYNYYQMMKLGQNPMNENEITVWMLLTACSFILSLGMNGLAVTNMLTILVNITQIDMLKGTFRWNDKTGMLPNPFNLGPFTNYSTLFEGELWTFWWPTALVPRFDGSRYPMVPPITDQDKKTLFPHVQEMLKDPIEKNIPENIEELYERQKENYKNSIFFFLGEQFRLEDDEGEKEFKSEEALEKEQEKKQVVSKGEDDEERQRQEKPSQVMTQTTKHEEKKQQIEGEAVAEEQSLTGSS